MQDRQLGHNINVLYIESLYCVIFCILISLYSGLYISCARVTQYGPRPLLLELGVNLLRERACANRPGETMATGSILDRPRLVSEGAKPSDGVPDMTVISDIDEHGINTNLKVRYGLDRIYVSEPYHTPIDAMRSRFHSHLHYKRHCRVVYMLLLGADVHGEHFGGSEPV